MRIPKYQWLMPETENKNCDFCDELIVPIDHEIKLQLISDSITNNIVTDGDFEYNPFPKATTTDLSFDITSAPSVDTYFILYLGTQIVVFERRPSLTTTQIGNLWIVGCGNGSASLYRARIKNFLISDIDTLIGTTTSLSGNTITIEDVPTETYVDDTAFATLSSVTSVSSGIAGIYAKNMYYNSVTKQMNYYYFNAVSTIGTFKENVSLLNGFNYDIIFGYATIHQFNFTLKIFDSSNVEVFSHSNNPLSISSTGAQLDNYFTCTSDDTYTLQFEFTPQFTTNQLAFDNISIPTFEEIVNVSSIDCNGNEVILDCDFEFKNGITLVTIYDALPSPFQLKFEDNNDNIFYSRWYTQLPQNDCINYLRVEWKSNCKFNELDYIDLPFLNSFYLTGFLNMQELDDLDSIDGISADGSKISIYKNTQETYEVRFHPYSMETMQTLQRIFQHSYILINGEEYNTTEVFRVSEIDLGIYTGRITLYKKGTQLISSICCC